MFRLFAILGVSILILGCAGPRIFIPGLPPPLIMLPQPKPKSIEPVVFDEVYEYTMTAVDSIHDMIDTSSILQSGWTGLVVWDLAADSVIMERYGNKMFTPASHVKLLTTYACLTTLGDSIPGLKYIENDTSIIFWGTGDPSFLNQKCKSTRVYDFLKSKSKIKKLYYKPQSIDAPYGEGWMWDDYNGAYQPEISAFPIFENMISFGYDKNNGWTQKPEIGTTKLITSKDYTIRRHPHANNFEISSSIDSLDFYQQKIPIYGVNDQIVKLLTDTLGVEVKVYTKMLDRKLAKTIFSIPTDTLVSEMMASSDNFLAEQLLLVCGHIIGDTLSTRWTIDTLLSSKMAHLIPKPKWVDGSGLSRYNLLAPTQSVQLLREMFARYPENRIFNLMSIGGQRGTLKSLYTDRSHPYVYAKTGTLGGVYNLTGYLITTSGRRLAFSIMNNHFSAPSSKARLETQKVIKQISKW